MTSLADVVDAVVGVDTHRDTHQVEIASPTASVIARTSIPNTSGGFADLLAWISAHAPGPAIVVCVEGTRSYGAALTRQLLAAGHTVIECPQPSRAQRRGKGKSDPIDAHLAVLSALAMDPDRLPTPRSDGDREALRILLNARAELTSIQTAQTNRLKALLLDGDDSDRAIARQKISQGRMKTLTQQQIPPDASRLQAIRLDEIKRLATAVAQSLHDERANEKLIQAIVDDLAPHLTDTPGIGPISAAQAIISYSHHGRCRNEAAFAALGGANPIPASSGRTTRHRLNRGGDRALNKALHTIAATRIRDDPRTRAYVQRRIAQGRTPREIRRCLKRYIARELYRTLTKTMITNTPST